MPPRPVPPDPFEHPALSPSLRELARRGQARRYRQGTVLIEEGDRGDTLYIILGGRLHAFGSSLDGAREIVYGSFGPGEYVGEMSLDGGPRAATVIADEASVCAVVTRATLRAYIAECPDFAFELITKLIRRARAATMSAKQLALNDVYGRLKAMLESDAAPDADGRLAAARLTQQAMSNRLGCSREMVSRVLKDLVVGEYVAIEGRRIVLLKALPVRW